MAVKVHSDRKALVLEWEPGDYEGKVEIVTVNSADESDVSSTKLESNAGHAAVSFPLAYVGTFNATVKSDVGDVIDGPDEIEVA